MIGAAQADNCSKAISLPSVVGQLRWNADPIIDHTDFYRTADLKVLFVANVSNPAQTRSPRPDNLYLPGNLKRGTISEGSRKRLPGRKHEGESMEPGRRPLRNRLRRRLAFITDLFAKFMAILTLHPKVAQLQRVCPFCGLITSRHKTCLECGKSLKAA